MTVSPITVSICRHVCIPAISVEKPGAGETTAFADARRAGSPSTVRVMANAPATEYVWHGLASVDVCCKSPVVVYLKSAEFQEKTVFISMTGREF